jgi:spore maturation protein CgeB
MKLLIIGYSQPGQMGQYLASAADSLALDYQIMDLGQAETNNRFVQKLYWHLRDKRPANLKSFAAQVVKACAYERPSIVLTTGGRAPLERSHIEKMRTLGAKVVNFSTDDPWNPVLRAPWFLSALPAYDIVFTPRRANVGDFHRCGVAEIHYVPFGYDPQIHHPWDGSSPPAASCDMLFVGGCDDERLPLIGALADAGFELALFGRYWGSHAKTRAYSRGVANQGTIRAASASASIVLCLVRRANRDGHVMRSFEAAAIGGCILAEDTEDHRNLFGPHGGAACYFKTIPELLSEGRRLIADATERHRMSDRLRTRMSARNDTYAARLATMLKLARINASAKTLDGRLA